MTMFGQPIGYTTALMQEAAQATAHTPTAKGSSIIVAGAVPMENATQSQPAPQAGSARTQPTKHTKAQIAPGAA